MRKKLVALNLAFLLALSLLPIQALATAVKITLGQTISFNDPNLDGYSFTPSEDGLYTFKETTFATWGSLKIYNASADLLAEVVKNAQSYNSEVSVQLKKGNTYNIKYVLKNPPSNYRDFTYGFFVNYSESGQVNPILYSDQKDKAGESHWMQLNAGESLESIVLATASTTYNPRLSHLLCVMARSAYDNSGLTKENLRTLGFNVANASDYKDTFGDNIPTPYSIAKKTLSNGSQIVMITIRGSWGNLWEQSWLNNANIGLAALNGVGKHAGFESNANDIYNALNSLMGGVKNSNATYVITGHSQGAATANLLAVKLYDNDIPSSKVYNYNFACPNVACLLNSNDWNPNGVHDNIFNIGNVEDPVSFLPSNLVKAFVPRVSPLSTWGKFGQSRWFFPNESNRSAAGATGHNMVYYCRALEYEYPLSAFAQYGQLSTQIIMRVLSIHCPVDVQVYDKDGTLIAEIANNAPRYYSETDEVILGLV